MTIGHLLDDFLAVPRRVKEILQKMADNSATLNKLAEDLRAFGAGPFKALVDENARLRSVNADLEGEDAGESAATDNAVTAFNELTTPVTQNPDVPVEIPPVVVEEPTDGEPASPFV